MFRKWYFAVSLFALSSIVKAEWFVSQKGLPSVIGDRGDLSAIINYQSDGFLGLYFYSRMHSYPCTGNQIDQVASMLVNNTLIRFSRGCDGSSTYFFPSTLEGKGYVVREFSSKNFVTFYDSRGGYIDTLSAKGFRKMSDLMGEARGLMHGL